MPLSVPEHVMRTRSGMSSPREALPGWFETTLAILLCALLGFALTGLPLAMMDRFEPLPVAAGTGAGTAALLLLWRPGTVCPRVPRASSVAVWTLLVFVVLVTGTNVLLSSEDLLVQRDPGIYVTSARWLADEGTVRVDASRPPFDDLGSRFALGHGYYDAQGDGRFSAERLHLLSAILAVGAWVGDSWLLVRGNAVIGGLALLTIFAFGSRMMRPWLAFAATAALAMGLPQVHFARDAYTEILTQVFVFGGLWVLWEARSRLDLGRGVIAGLLIGSTCMVRIDSFVLVVPLVAYLVYELWGANALSGEIRATRRRFVAAVGAGASVPIVLGLTNGFLFSPTYLGALRSSLELVGVAIAVAVVGGAVLLLARPLLQPLATWALRYRRSLAVLGILAIVVGLSYALFGRPHLEYAVGTANVHVGGLQLREGLEVDPRRRYGEMSMWWLLWYLGPLLIAGLLGYVRALWRMSVGHERRIVPFLLIFSVMTALYVWRPSIVPDQIWAMRRFLPVTLPGFILLALWVVDGAWGWRRWPIVRAVAVAVVAVSLAFSAWTLVPVLEARTQRGMLAATDQLCDALPVRAAVVVRDRELLGLAFPQTVRSFCRVPVAVPPAGEPSAWFEEVARRQHERGGGVVVLSPDGEPIQIRGRSVVPEPLLTVSWEFLERKLSGRPDDYERETFSLFMAELPPP